MEERCPYVGSVEFGCWVGACRTGSRSWKAWEAGGCDYYWQNAAEIMLRVSLLPICLDTFKIFKAIPDRQAVLRQKRCWIWWGPCVGRGLATQRVRVATAFSLEGERCYLTWQVQEGAVPQRHGVPVLLPSCASPTSRTPVWNSPLCRVLFGLRGLPWFLHFQITVSSSW